VEVDNSWSRLIAIHAQFTDRSTDGKSQCKSTGTDTDNPLSDMDKPMITKVVGVTYEGRQAIVALLSIGEEVLLVRDPSNPHDGNAIKVTRKDWLCFGLINRFLAARLASLMDEYGHSVKAMVIFLNGGYFSCLNLGVVLQFNLQKGTNTISYFQK